MILYNVTVKVDKDIQADWLQWMRSEHIPAVMATGKFTEYRICRMLHEEEDGKTYAVQYFCPDMETFYQYQQEHAARLQQEHKKRYEGRYVSFRTLMEVIE